MATISVITIVKNNGVLLARAAQSVKNQDFEDYEYLIINDGSTDQTGAVIDNLARENNKIKIIHLNKNLGRAQARNTGLDRAVGKYVFFLDSDDCLPADALSSLYLIAEEDQADIIYGAMLSFERNINKSNKSNYRNTILQSEKRKITLEDFPRLVGINSVINCLFRNQFLRENQLRFSTDRRNAEDVSFAFYAAYHARLITVAANTFSYYYSVGNFLSAANEQKLSDSRDAKLEIMRFAGENASIPVKTEMYITNLKFAANLTRAQRVYGPGEKLKIHLASLQPFFLEAPQEIIDRLPRGRKKFVVAMQKNNVDAAYRLWLKSKRARQERPLGKIWVFFAEIRERYFAVLGTKPN